MNAEQTISEIYLIQQKELHRNPNYGIASISFAPIIKDLIEHAKISSLSDYGAGKKNLLHALNKLGCPQIDYRPYDPAFPEYGKPLPAELVCCIDVLEHIEEEFIQNVLSELKAMTHKILFASIHMGPAGKFLPDGRNAHLIQKPTSWWLPILAQHFEILELRSHNMFGKGFWFVAKARK